MYLQQKATGFLLPQKPCLKLVCSAEDFRFNIQEACFACRPLVCWYQLFKKANIKKDEPCIPKSFLSRTLIFCYRQGFEEQQQLIAKFYKAA
jgi:hypothetical protein